MNLRIRLPRSVYRRAPLGFIVLSLGISAHADPAERSVAPSGAATNQAASVEEPVTLPLSEPGGTADGKGIATQSGPPSAAPSVSSPRSLHRRSPLRTSDDSVGTSTQPWYRSTLGSLVIVLAIIGALYIAVRRFVPTKRLTGGDGSMVIASRIPIDAKHSLALVKVGQRFLVVGISPDRLDSLCEIAETGEVADLAARTGMALTGGQGPFRRALNEAADEYDNPDAPPGEGNAHGIGAVTPRALRDLLGRVNNWHVDHKSYAGLGARRST